MAAEIAERTRIQRASGRAMSCDVSVVTVGESAMSPADAINRLHQLERRWSRFLPDSELSQLNASAGQEVTVSADTLRLVVALVEAWHLTNGAFDPTLLVPIVGLGYAASRDDATLHTSLAPLAAPKGRPERVMVDPVRSTITLPVGTSLDPGGLGKGLAADIVAKELRSSGAEGALVEVGGDLRVSGTAPDDDAWTIAVRHGTGDAYDIVRLRDGGVATSTTRLRTWEQHGTPRHHLIDPATLEPTTGDTVAATAIAGTAAWAEAMTKPAFVLGPRGALKLAEHHGVAVNVTTQTGGQVATSTWFDYAYRTVDDETGASS